MAADENPTDEAAAIAQGAAGAATNAAGNQVPGEAGAAINAASATVSAAAGIANAATSGDPTAAAGAAIGAAGSATGAASAIAGATGPGGAANALGAGANAAQTADSIFSATQGAGGAASALGGGIAGGAGAVASGAGALGLGDVASAASAVQGIASTAAGVASAVESVSQMVRNAIASFGPEVEYKLTTRNASGGDGRLNTDTWIVNQVSIHEALNAPFTGTLIIGTEEMDIDPTALVGADAHLEVTREPVGRSFRAVISEVEYGGIYERVLLLRITIVPAFALLAQRVSSRIFENKTVAQILEAVLTPGLQAYGRIFDKAALNETYPIREYCVQYAESDFDFCSRLMEEEGIAYHFIHTGADSEAEVLALADENADYQRVSLIAGEAVPLILVGGSLSSVESVFEFKRVNRLVPTSIWVRDFDWTDPTRPVEDREQATQDAHQRNREVYDHTHELTIGNYENRQYSAEDHARQALLRRKLQAFGEKVSMGTGYVTGFKPGMTFELSGHRDPDLNGEYLLLSVEHHKGAPPGQENVAAAQNYAYYNTFYCIPIGVEYVPERRRKKPRIYGIQTARVCGPEPTQPHTDAHGRIKLHFYWDRESEFTVEHTCWVRVRQTWAGPNWGHQFIPYPGMEAVVTFLDGNPDRPLCIGTVYNGENGTMYPLNDPSEGGTDERLNSGIKTVTGNELRFKDVAGAEEIYIHAQFDQREVVEHNHSTTVHVNQTNTVDGTQSETIGGDQTLTANSNRTKTVRLNETSTVRGNREENIIGTDTINVTKTRTQTITEAETITNHSTRTETVTGLETINLNGQRELTIRTQDTFTVNGSKTDHVTGTHHETTDTKYWLTQGSTNLTLEGNVTTLSGGNNIELFNGGGRVFIDNGGKIVNLEAGEQIQLICGNSSLTLKKDGTIEIGGTVKIAMAVGPSSISLEPAEIKVNGATVGVTGTAALNLTGATLNEN